MNDTLKAAYAKRDEARKSLDAANVFANESGDRAERAIALSMRAQSQVRELTAQLDGQRESYQAAVAEIDSAARELQEARKERDHANVLLGEALASLRQVEDVLTVHWITVENGDYRNALHRLISRNIEMANDPAISQEAADRVEELAELRARVSGLEGLVSQAKSAITTVEPMIGWAGWVAGDPLDVLRCEYCSGLPRDAAIKAIDHDRNCPVPPLLEALAALSADPLKVGDAVKHLADVWSRADFLKGTLAGTELGAALDGLLLAGKS